jgi:hypothetical protein
MLLIEAYEHLGQRHQGEPRLGVTGAFGGSHQLPNSLGVWTGFVGVVFGRGHAVISQPLFRSMRPHLNRCAQRSRIGTCLQWLSQKYGAPRRCDEFNAAQSRGNASTPRREITAAQPHSAIHVNSALKRGRPMSLAYVGLDGRPEMRR